MSDGNEAFKLDSEVGNESGMNEIGAENASRAKSKTILLGGSIAQQLREKLSLDRAVSSEDSGGYVYPFSNNTDSGYSLFKQISNQPGTNRPSDYVEKQDEVSTSSQAIPAVVSSDPLVGFMVSYDNSAAGEYYPLRQGRWIVTSAQVNEGRYIGVVDGSVSDCHATIKVSSTDDIQIMDQFSENGTGITRRGCFHEEIATLGRLQHGDTLRLGGRKFHICLVQKQ